MADYRRDHFFTFQNSVNYLLLLVFWKPAGLYQKLNSGLDYFFHAPRIKIKEA